MTQKHFISWLVMALLCLPVFAQIQEPVKFKTELKTLSANEAEIIFSGAVENGWHIYSTDLPEGGPISATFNVDKIEGAEVVGKLMPRGKEIEKMDPIFEMKVRYFEKQATFVQKIKLTGGDYKIVGYLEYGACNDENCLPPTSVDFAFTGKAAGNTPATAETAITENTATELHRLHRLQLSLAALPTIGHRSSPNWEITAKTSTTNRIPGYTSSSPVCWVDCWPCSHRVSGRLSR